MLIQFVISLIMFYHYNIPNYLAKKEYNYLKCIVRKSLNAARRWENIVHKIDKSFNTKIQNVFSELGRSLTQVNSSKFEHWKMKTIVSDSLITRNNDNNKYTFKCLMKQGSKLKFYDNTALHAKNRVYFITLSLMKILLRHTLETLSWQRKLNILTKMKETDLSTKQTFNSFSISVAL